MRVIVPFVDDGCAGRNFQVVHHGEKIFGTQVHRTELKLVHPTAARAVHFIPDNHRIFII